MAPFRIPAIIYSFINLCLFYANLFITLCQFPSILPTCSHQIKGEPITTNARDSWTRGSGAVHVRINKLFFGGRGIMELVWHLTSCFLIGARNKFIFIYS